MTSENKKGQENINLDDVFTELTRLIDERKNLSDTIENLRTLFLSLSKEQEKLNNSKDPNKILEWRDNNKAWELLMNELYPSDKTLSFPKEQWAETEPNWTATAPKGWETEEDYKKDIKGTVFELVDLFPDYEWDWKELTRNPELPLSYLMKFPHKNWDLLELHRKQDIFSFVEKFPDKNWNWLYLALHTNVTIEFLKKHMDKFGTAGLYALSQKTFKK